MGFYSLLKGKGANGMKVLLTATVQSHICQFHRPLVEMLHQHGCQVHVAARNNLAEKNGLKLDFVDKVYNVPFSRSPRSRDNIEAYKQLKAIIDREKYDIIHCNTPMGGVVTRLAARKARKNGTKVFYTAHGFHFYKGSSKAGWLLYYPVEKLLSRITDTMITINSEDRICAEKHFGCKVSYIHGVGADISKYRILPEEEKAEFRNTNGFFDRFTILCTGELNQNKNQRTVIRAIAQLKERGVNPVLILAGNGPEDGNLKQLVANLGVEDSVFLVGYRTDLEKFINISDLIVSASYREGLGMNLIEGMLCQKPVIASDNRGHRDIVQDGVNGYRVVSGSPEAFAEKIEELMLDDEKRRSMAQKGYELALSFTKEQVKKELNDIYFA